MLFHDLARAHRWMAVTAAVLAVGAMAAAGCGTGALASDSPTLIVLHDDANGKTVPAGAGDRIELILGSSYWNVTGSSAPRVLRQDGPAVLLPRPSSCPAIPGLGCTPVRVDFTALSGGKAVIAARRSSCGEALRCRPGQTRFTLTVVVSGHG